MSLLGFLKRKALAVPEIGHDERCPCCGGKSKMLDVVDFNKSCEEANGMFIELSGIPIYYDMCTECGFTFSPSIYGWDESLMASMIYNDDYIKVDPDFAGRRTESNHQSLVSTFGSLDGYRHLDYGGGNGGLSSKLKESGWNSSTFDPYMTGQERPTGKFDLITSYEVFEHVQSPKGLIDDIDSLLSEDGLVLFSTLLSDNDLFRNNRINWWYASPRNGHISLFSKKALEILFAKSGMTFVSLNQGMHVAYRKESRLLEFLRPKKA